MPKPDRDKSIGKLRKDIDGLDEKILSLINQRAEIAIKIGGLKKANQSQLRAPGREIEILDRILALNQGPFPNEALRAIFREIMSASLALEGPLKVSYLGPKATFTHLACLQQFGFSATYVPVSSIKDVFSEVERGRVEFGVVPIENSTEGVVNHTLDMFMDSSLRIVGEVSQEVSHHLMNRSGKMDDVKRLFSHPHAIAQCRLWLENKLPHIPVTEVSSTAKAAKVCVEDPSAAAIAAELAAQLYGLQIIQRRIEDNINNFTRFLVISQKGLGRTGRDKTSIMFAIKDQVGALHEMLLPFSQHKINLTKIESRPSKKKAWEYVFFVDLTGHAEDEKVQAVLENLKEQCMFLKVLGSYPFAGEKPSSVE